MYILLNRIPGVIIYTTSKPEKMVIRTHKLFLRAGKIIIFNKEYCTFTIFKVNLTALIYLYFVLNQVQLSSELRKR